MNDTTHRYHVDAHFGEFICIASNPEQVRRYARFHLTHAPVVVRKATPEDIARVDDVRIV